MKSVPVCVFARPPRPGEAKTRLARTLGNERAARLAQAFLRDTWATVQGLRWARPVLAGTEPDPAAFGLGPVELWPQGDGDLGERMERVLRRALATAPRALIIGADLPGLPAAHLEAALAQLEQTEVVLGPAADGGFYLLGARRFVDGALQGVTWSASSTLAQTQAQLRRAGLSLGRAPDWFDVDESADLERLREVLGERPHAAPHTRAELG